MKKTIIILALLVSGLSFAQSQFETGMNKAMGLWKEGKSNEASDLFERIAAADKTSWLPNYYVALVNTTSSFSTQDKEKVSAMLAKAQKALDVEFVKAPNNPELMVMQALIHTAWVVFDPMTNGMKLSMPIMELYTKAQVLAPTNPRVVFGKAEYEINGAKWTGANVKELCKEVDNAVLLFKSFKPETPFHPSWGLDRALEKQKECNK